MSARGRGRRRRGGHAEHENEERWLLTYADMITLLMALFIVMWSVSVVNTGKFDELKVSLREAFSHKAVLQSDRSILSSTGSPSSAFTIVPATLPPRTAVQRAFHRAEEESLERVQPLLGLHGHIHESHGFKQLGRAVAVNPGSDYGTGALNGVLVTLERDRVKAHQFVRG